jgi:tetratricopeptide (TPR) repeat protein
MHDFYFSQGNQFLRDKKLDQAIAAYREAICLNPDLYPAYLNLAEALFKANEIDESNKILEQLEELIRNSPQNSSSLKETIQKFRSIHDSQSKTSNSFQDESTFLNTDHIYKKIDLSLKSRFLTDIKNHKNPESYVQETIERNPEDSQAYFYLGHLKAEQEDWSKAVECYQHSLRLSPGDLEAQVAIGYALEKLGRYSEAIEGYRQALIQGGESGEILFRLGRALSHQQHWTEAIVEYRRAIALGFQQPQVHYYLGQALAQLGQWQHTVTEWTSVLAVYPGAATVRQQLAHILMGLGQWQAALLQWREYIRTPPGSSPNSLLDFKSKQQMYGKIPHCDDLNLTGDLTLEFWLFLREWPENWTPILSKFTQDSENEFCLRIKNSDLGQWYDSQTYQVPVQWVPSQHIQLNRWSHITCVRKSGHYGRVYCNGVLVAERNWTGAQPPNPTDAPIHIMGDLSQQKFQDGQVSQLRIWNHAKTGDNIQTILYQPTKEVRDLVGSWHLPNPENSSNLVNSLVDGHDNMSGTLIRNCSQTDFPLKITICGSKISKSTEYKISEIYKKHSNVEVIQHQVSTTKKTENFHYDFPLKIHKILWTNKKHFLKNAIDSVLSYPCKTCYLSNPTIPDLILGLFYSLIWDASVITDISSSQLKLEPAKNLGDKVKAGLQPAEELKGEAYIELASSLSKKLEQITSSTHGHKNILKKDDFHEMTFQSSDTSARLAIKQFLKELPCIETALQDIFIQDPGILTNKKQNLERIKLIWEPDFILDYSEENQKRIKASQPQSKVNRIVLLTCVWKRPELTKIILSYYKLLQKKLSKTIDIKLLAIGSEGGDSHQLCHDCGFDYLEHPNKPLSSKWEYGLNRCADYNPDAVVIFGSDDLLSQTLIEFYDSQLKANSIFLGIQDGYFFDLSNQKLFWWKGYSTKQDSKRVGETIGMGRCLSRKLLDKLEFSIWNGIHLNSNLDGAMTNKLQKLGVQLGKKNQGLILEKDNELFQIGHHGFKMSDISGCAIDIKFLENLTPIQRYYDRDSSTLVEQSDCWQILDEHFPEDIIFQLKQLVGADKTVDIALKPYNLGTLDIESKSIDKVETIFSTVMKDQLICFKQAQSYLRKNQYKNAIDKCADFFRSSPLLKDIFPVLAEAYSKQGHPKESSDFANIIQDVRRLFAVPKIEEKWGGEILNFATLKNSDYKTDSLLSKNNTIVILTCVWKRPQLTEIVLSYYATLQQELKGFINLELLAVGSEEKESEKLCQACGFDYVEYRNQPLSDKWEYGLNRCKDYDPNAVIIVGSDDLISRSLIEFYDQKIKEGLVFCGITDAYFLDLPTNEMIHWVGYTSNIDPVRLGETTGMGRCLSRPLLDKLEFSIWKNLNKDRSLDGAMTQKLYEFGLELLDEKNCPLTQVDTQTLRIGHCGFNLAEMNAMALDIKFTENLTTFDRYGQRSSVVKQENSWDLIAQYFPKTTLEQLKAIANLSLASQTTVDLPSYTNKTVTEPKIEFKKYIAANNEKSYPTSILEECHESLFLFSGKSGRYDLSYAKKYNAKNVMVNDIRADFIDEIQKNYPKDWSYIAANAFELVNQNYNKNRQFDLVSCDPSSGLISKVFDDHFDKLYAITRRYLVLTLTGEYIEQKRKDLYLEDDLKLAVHKIVYAKHNIYLDIADIIKRSKNYKGCYWLVVTKR